MPTSKPSVVPAPDLPSAFAPASASDLTPAGLHQLLDMHGAPLADFDYAPGSDLLVLRWRGHLTGESMVRGARAHLALAPFAGRPLPRRLLCDHRQASGDWSEALPLLHYEWLPQVLARGTRALAHVYSLDPLGDLNFYNGGPAFLAAFARQPGVRGRLFRAFEPAWQWLTRPTGATDPAV